MDHFLRVLLAIALTAGLARPSVTFAAANRPILSESMQTVIASAGIEQAESMYRQHRARGFAGVRESQADTNALGYRLLRHGNTDAAIRVFVLNAETYPTSANAHNSLGDAYLAAGQASLARAAFLRELALDPRSRGARYELARMEGHVLPELPWLVLFHVLAGALSIVAGALAMVAPKGRPTHRLAGKLFVGAMLAMTLSAVIRAAQHYEAEALNFWMALITLYLVTTGWRAARHRRASFSALDRGMPLVAIVIAGGLLSVAVQGRGFAGPAYVFSGVAVLSAVGDWRWLRLTTLTANLRVVRHLWRIGLALFVAVGSLFLGQPQVFPQQIRDSGVLALPGLLVLVSLAYWAVRYRFFNRGVRPGPKRAQESPAST